MAPRLFFLLAAVITFASLHTAPVSAFNRYTVGNSKGWNPGVNYSNWANDTHFYVGDWLVFYYQSGMADVLQVNKTAYEQCLSDAPISNYSKGRSYAFRLNHTGDYYFICSRGFCYGGMKLHILSEKVPPPAALPAHTSGAGSVRKKVARVLGVAAAVGAALLRSI